MIQRIFRALLGMKGNPFMSSKYWESRYAAGGNSGEGSYGRLAEFKADFLNNFTRDHDVLTAIELGCGDGNQLSMLKYPNYLGLDVSPTAVKICKRKFAGQKNFRFMTYRPERFNPGTFGQFDLAISLDVLYHLVELPTFETYMQHLFKLSTKHVIIYSSNEDHIENVHVVHRKLRNTLTII